MAKLTILRQHALVPDRLRQSVLVLVGGPGGCGKTTLANALADRMSLVHLSRDRVKASMATSDASLGDDDIVTFDAAKSAMGGEYGQRAFPLTYAAARVLLDGGASVVIEQAWRSDLLHDEVRALAEDFRTALVVAVTSPDVAMSRMQQRGDRAGLASVTDSVSATRKDWQQYVDLDVGSPRLEVDTTSGYDPSLAEIERWIWRAVCRS